MALEILGHHNRCARQTAVGSSAQARLFFRKVIDQLGTLCHDRGSDAVAADREIWVDIESTRDWKNG